MGQLILPAMILSTVLGAVGSYTQAAAQKSQAKYESAVSANNAIYAKMASDRNLALAEDAKKRGETEEYRQRLKTKNVAAQQQSAFAASNVDISTGSPLEYVSDTFMLGELDAQTVRNNAAREASGYENAAWQDRVQGSNYQAQSQLYSMQAKSTSPFLSGFTSLLDGATTTYGTYKSRKGGY